MNETHYGLCNNCGYSGELDMEDFGIGPYEMGSKRGYHRDVCPVCPVCDSANVDITSTDYDVDDLIDRREALR